MNYYQMLYADDDVYAPFGVAYSPSSDLFLIPFGGTPVGTWEPLCFSLRDGDFADYLANDAGVRLCSERMKEIVESQSLECDKLQWLEIEVAQLNRQGRKYHILHFPMDFPVVNRSESIMAGDFVVKAVFNGDIVKEHSVFGLPGDCGAAYVSEKVRRAIESAHLTGMSFARVRLA